MREGSAEVVVACQVETAFAWLADPRNAAEWFASVALPEPPARPLRVGTTWRFSMTRQRGKSIPMRLAEYQPSRSFAWETDYPAWRGNLRWTLTLSPAEPEAPDEAGERETGAGPMTRLLMTIRQQPGPLGWPLVVIAALIGRLGATEGASIAARAERAAVRAGEALEALPTRSPRGQRSGKGKGGKRR
ncbi:MAG TPA: SRPBCC family protein [Ktedonobacterales bacterium]|nr:SRPBCC family protein [Ktedonobacterales bacterium]